MAANLKQLIQQYDKNARLGMENAVRDSLKGMKLHLDDVVSNWKKKPKFQILLFKGGDTIIGVLKSGQHGDLWKWIDKGTGLYGPRRRSYVIVPRFKPMLKFQTGYLPRTKPIAKFNTGPGRAFGSWVTTGMVIHPGIKARQFSKTYIEKTLRPELRYRIAKAIRR